MRGSGVFSCLLVVAWLKFATLEVGRQKIGRLDVFRRIRLVGMRKLIA